MALCSVTHIPLPSGLSSLEMLVLCRRSPRGRPRDDGQQFRNLSPQVSWVVVGHLQVIFKLHGRFDKPCFLPAVANGGHLQVPPSSSRLCILADDDRFNFLRACHIAAEQDCHTKMRLLPSFALLPFEVDCPVWQELLRTCGFLPSESRDEYHSLVYVRGQQHYCRQCTYVTKYKSSMNAHLRTHTGERPFKCPMCTNRFTQNANLKKHLRSHTGERPFKCHLCPNKFTQKCHLKQHLLSHTGERPFSCVHCNASFSRKEILDKHMSSHTGKKS
nr:zinc finger protein 189-like [Dermacentor andersoni]